MWFFAEFCLRYGKKLYADRAMPFPEQDHSPLLGTFLVFSRILVFEQIVDHFNKTMAADATLPEVIRSINRVHHQDESRHIAFGCQLVNALFGNLKRHGAEADITFARDYLERYITASVTQLYSVDVYRDAGIPDPYKFRLALLADPSRPAAHERITARTRAFYQRIGLFSDRSTPQASTLA